MPNPSFSLRVFPSGAGYYAVLEVTTPYGHYRVGSQYFYSAPTPEEAAHQVLACVMRLANWKGSQYRGVGRKPRNYWHACCVARLLSRIGLAASHSLTSAGCIRRSA